MATVPGPHPDRPLPSPGAPAEVPEREYDEEDEQHNPWEAQPYDPEREYVEPEAPVAVP